MMYWWTYVVPGSPLSVVVKSPPWPWLPSQSVVFPDVCLN